MLSPKRSDIQGDIASTLRKTLSTDRVLPFAKSQKSLVLAKSRQTLFHY
jgi:hypothetical protein